LTDGAAGVEVLEAGVRVSEVAGGDGVALAEVGRVVAVIVGTGLVLVAVSVAVAVGAEGVLLGVVVTVVATAVGAEAGGSVAVGRAVGRGVGVAGVGSPADIPAAVTWATTSVGVIGTADWLTQGFQISRPSASTTRVNKAPTPQYRALLRRTSRRLGAGVRGTSGATRVAISVCVPPGCAPSRGRSALHNSAGDWKRRAGSRWSILSTVSATGSGRSTRRERTDTGLPCITRNSNACGVSA
jgi:hypothetical protein